MERDQIWVAWGGYRAFNGRCEAYGTVRDFPHMCALVGIRSSWILSFVVRQFALALRCVRNQTGANRVRKIQSTS